MPKTKTAKSEIATETTSTGKLGPKLQAILDIIRKLLTEGKKVTPEAVAVEAGVTRENANAHMCNLAKRELAEWHGEKGGPTKPSTRHLKLKG